jgi:hypothetical protein
MDTEAMLENDQQIPVEDDPSQQEQQQQQQEQQPMQQQQQVQQQQSLQLKREEEEEEKLQQEENQNQEPLPQASNPAPANQPSSECRLEPSEMTLQQTGENEAEKEEGKKQQQQQEEQNQTPSQQQENTVNQNYEPQCSTTTLALPQSPAAPDHQDATSVFRHAMEKEFQSAENLLQTSKFTYQAARNFVQALRKLVLEHRKSGCIDSDMETAFMQRSGQTITNIMVNVCFLLFVFFHFF